jgi:acyl carrier protein
MCPAEITKILAEYLITACRTLPDVKNVEDTSLGDALDSLGMLHFLMFLEERFDIKIESADVSPEQFSNLISVSEFVSRKLATQLGS